ncbi:DUF6880 family protein [Pararhodobacter sp. SW119]|uniref:DUF6880 family protein n=1 Tax=Pararhodobacter sp. SW119 TaxID=2780075 RepID=UPI001ADF83A8|nr:DUF6880 family protein [Pararhodobacter sp. SW119]
MVQDTLDGAKSKRHRYAARHLAECPSCDNVIDDYGSFPVHAQFVEALKQKHRRKYGFWELVARKVGPERSFSQQSLSVRNGDHPFCKLGLAVRAGR